MAKSIVGDWDYSPEDLKRLDRAVEDSLKLHAEMKRRGVKTMSAAEVKQFWAGKSQPTASSPVPPPLKPRKGKP